MIVPKCKIFLFLFVFQWLLLVPFNKVAAQKIQYSNENVFIDYPHNLQLLPAIGGNHHLLNIVDQEYLLIFVFNQQLVLQAQTRLPFKLAERSEVRIIPFADYYYVYIHERFSPKYSFWKVDAHGNYTDCSAAFQKIIVSQVKNVKLGFQLLNIENELWMVYHTDLSDLTKSTVVVVKTDSLLNIVLEHKVQYDFSRETEELEKEMLMFGRYLLVLKTMNSGTSLEIMKVNLATGFTIRNKFSSSGYFFNQSGIHYNTEDSSVTISSLLTEPTAQAYPKRFIFVSRLNKILVEQSPFAVLKSQFAKRTSTSFLLVDGLSKWVSISKGRGVSMDAQPLLDIDGSPLSYSGNTYSIEDVEHGIRFSLLSKELKIISDTLVPNRKNSYNLKAGPFARFSANNKDYLLMIQEFSQRKQGLLMINANDAHHLLFTDIAVNDRNEYLLQKAKPIPQSGIVIPYTNKKEVGLVKITVE